MTCNASPVSHCSNGRFKPITPDNSRMRVHLRNSTSSTGSAPALPGRHLTRKNSALLHDHLIYHCKYDVTIRFIKTAILRPQAVTSFGSLSCSDEAWQAEEVK